MPTLPFLHVIPGGVDRASASLYGSYIDSDYQYY